MKRLLLLLTISFLVCCNNTFSQENNENEIPVYTGQCGYLTTNKDTLYVRDDMYPLFVEVWDIDNIKPKPIIIPIDSVEKFYRKEDDNSK